MMKRRAFLAAIAGAAVAPALPAPTWAELVEQAPVADMRNLASLDVITIYALLSSGELISEVMPAYLKSHVRAEALHAIADGHVRQCVIIGPEILAR